MMLLTAPAVRVMCGAYFDGWRCSRPNGHGGRHLATYSCGVRGRRVVVRVWGEDVHKAARQRGIARRLLAAAVVAVDEAMRIAGAA